MYKIEILEEINKVKNLMQEIEFKALFYNQPLSKNIQSTYTRYQNELTTLNNLLNRCNNP